VFRLSARNSNQAQELAEMSDIWTKIADFSPKVSVMSSVADARSILIELIGPRPVGFRIKQAFAELSDLTGFGERRVKGILRGEARRIDAEEMRVLERLKSRSIEKTKDHASYFEAQAASLEAKDADFYRGEIDRLRALAGRIRSALAGKVAS
jgi:hypothetical protein